MTEKFEAIKPFANDEHFAIREKAWFVMRGAILENLEESIAILSKWSEEEDPNLRCFASEATRPRGVWTKHINELKESLELALSILEPLKSYKEKYVQDSVGNWLNDASKTKPEWVENLCKN
ncbi:MAG: DNA alkylation repair protein [Methanobacteriaceae archaeon]|nr:DNA alkylation repair protein [Candidatus Methanorudis spinitermitis]